MQPSGLTNRTHVPTARPPRVRYPTYANLAGTARAPFLAGVRGSPSSQPRAGVEARPYSGLRGLTGDVITPHRRRPNPSVTVQSAATAPLSGEPRAWVEACSVYASVYHDADTVVFLSPVRGGVLDAPTLPVRRGGMVAAVERDQLHPRHLRCVRLRLSPNVCKSRGHSPRTISCGDVPVYSRPPLRCKNPPAGPVDFFQVSSTPHIAPLRWPTTIQLLYTAGVASNLPEQLSASYCSPVRPSSRYIYWPSVQ